MISSKAGGDVYILCNDKKLCITYRGTGAKIQVLNSNIDIYITLLIMLSIIIYLYFLRIHYRRWIQWQGGLKNNVL